MLQWIAEYCNVNGILWSVAVSYIVLQYYWDVAVFGSVLRCVAEVYCNVIGMPWSVAVGCNGLQCLTVYYNITGVLQSVPVGSSGLQCIANHWYAAVCCSVLRGVAGCCRMLQGVAGCCKVLQYLGYAIE